MPSLPPLSMWISLSSNDLIDHRPILRLPPRFCGKMASHSLPSPTSLRGTFNPPSTAQLSYYAEQYRLLPDTQFGGRPGRTTEQALLVLANAIDQAWLRDKVVTLVVFDLKGAFNGVNSTTLDARLQERGIPSVASRWIQSFMEERSASIKFDGFETKVTSLKNAGLAQGSPFCLPSSIQIWLTSPSTRAEARPRTSMTISAGESERRQKKTSRRSGLARGHHTGPPHSHSTS